MRAAKGPFHATIWEQPLTLGVGPIRASRLSLVVVGMRVSRSIKAGLAALRLVVLACPNASGWYVQFNICMRGSGRTAVCRLPVCVGVCLCRCGELEAGNNITTLLINEAFLRQIQGEGVGYIAVIATSCCSNSFRFIMLEINICMRAKVGSR